jgi:hypothetical protein
MMALYIGGLHQLTENLMQVPNTKRDSNLKQENSEMGIGE